MALNLFNDTGNLKAILRRDNALAQDLTDDEWNAYLKNLDESHLRFIPGGIPTRFIMKKIMNYGAQKLVDNEKIGINAEGKPEVKIAHMYEEVRCALVDVENPADASERQRIIFKKDPDGYADKDLVAMLGANGVVAELYGMRQNIIQGANNAKK